MNRVRTVLLTSDSPWQRALAARMASEPYVDLAGVVVQGRRSTMRASWIVRNLWRNPRSVARKSALRLRFGGVMAEIAREELRRFGVDGAPLPWPPVEVLEVEDINTPDVVAFLERTHPQAAAVSGTSIIREPVISMSPPEVFLNLHTGLSPYYKGGPNCTLWALSRGEPEFIGATLHILDPGIDTGAILVSAHTPLDRDETLAGAVSASVALGHDLYLRALSAVARGETLSPVPQGTLGEGRTFYTREWRAAEMARAVDFVGTGGLARWVDAGRPGLERARAVDTLEGPHP